MSSQLVTKLMTLNDLEPTSGVFFEIFSNFCQLSQLTMSSRMEIGI